MYFRLMRKQYKDKVAKISVKQTNLPWIKDVVESQNMVDDNHTCQQSKPLHKRVPLTPVQRKVNHFADIMHGFVSSVFWPASQLFFNHLMTQQLIFLLSFFCTFFSARWWHHTWWFWWSCKGLAVGVISLNK